MNVDRSKLVAMKIKLLSEKAGELLAKGDALATVNPTESRRLLRECVSYRLRARGLRVALLQEKNEGGEGIAG